MELFEKILTKGEINNRFILAVNAVIGKHLIPSKTALAESLNVKPAKFSEILNGRMKAGVDMIAVMCDFYKVSPDWLLMSRGDNIFRESSQMPKIWVDDDNLRWDYPDEQEQTKKTKPISPEPSNNEMFLSILREKDKTIKEQAEEIGRLKEQIRQMTIEKEKHVSPAATSNIANAG